MDQEYKLCTARDASRLDEQVNRYLSQGWSLHGSPAITRADGITIIYAQALIRMKMQAGDPGWA